MGRQDVVGVGVGSARLLPSSAACRRADDGWAKHGMGETWEEKGGGSSAALGCGRPPFSTLRLSTLRLNQLSSAMPVRAAQREAKSYKLHHDIKPRLP